MTATKAKKPQYDLIEAQTREIIAEWETRLGLSHWEIDHVFLDSYQGEDQAGSEFHCAGVTEARPQYFQAKVKYYLPSLVRLNLHELERLVVHELTHVLLAFEQNLLDPEELPKLADAANAASDYIRDLMSDRLETSTEMVTKALLSAHPPMYPEITE